MTVQFVIIYLFIIYFMEFCREEGDLTRFDTLLANKR